MAKKIVGADGKKYKVKKPFYKHVWFWIVVAIVIIAVGANLGGGSDSKKNSSSSKTASSKKASSSTKKQTDGKITLADYNSFKIGDMSDNGAGATKKADIVNKFKDPSSTSTSTLDKTTVDMDTWDNVDGDITASFVGEFANNNLVSKAITGIKVSRSSKIDLAKFNAVANGQSEAQVRKALGDPNGISENLIAGTTTKMLTYSSGLKGDVVSSVTITLQADKVTGKSQTGLK